MPHFRQDRVTQDLIDAIAVYLSMLHIDYRLNYKDFVDSMNLTLDGFVWLDPKFIDFERAYVAYTNYNIYRTEYEKKKK